jgi:hypothetical protein
VSGSPVARDRLRNLAERLVWWQPPDATLADTPRFLAQVMAYGDWQEASFAIETFSEAAMVAALRDAPPGVFDDRSWSYWHVRLGIDPVPPLPRRRL